MNETSGVPPKVQAPYGGEVLPARAPPSLVSSSPSPVQHNNRVPKDAPIDYMVSKFEPQTRRPITRPPPIVRHRRAVIFTRVRHRTMDQPVEIIEYQAAREAFVLFLTRQASIIRLRPSARSIEEVRINLGEPVVKLLNEIVHTALMMSCDAADHPFVTAKPFGYYDNTVVQLCLFLRKILPNLARRLCINPRWDMVVHFILRNILADLGF
ncbi:unnamed protein product [Penicillium bialowiezense]